MRELGTLGALTVAKLLQPYLNLLQRASNAIERIPDLVAKESHEVALGIGSRLRLDAQFLLSLSLLDAHRVLKMLSIQGLGSV
jgi:hypothetical protein